MPKYNIEVKLAGKNGNVFNLISLCIIAMKQNKISTDEIELFKVECLSGDYDNALLVMQNWFIVK